MAITTGVIPGPKNATASVNAILPGEIYAHRPPENYPKTTRKLPENYRRNCIIMEPIDWITL